MKTPTYNPGLHDVVLKVRLTETDAATLRAIAEQKGLKLATLARVLLKKQIHSITTAYLSSACSEGPKRGSENLDGGTTDLQPTDQANSDGQRGSW